MEGHEVGESKSESDSTGRRSVAPYPPVAYVIESIGYPAGHLIY